MPKQPRVLLTPFGSTGPVDDFARFGSQRLGVPVKTKDILDIQSLAPWLTGWKNAINNANKAPFLEDMNALLLVMGYMQTYMFQEGIPEWEPNTTYFIGSIVKKANTTELYGSLVDNNTGNSLPIQATDGNWQYLPRQQSGQRRPNMIDAGDFNSVNLEANTPVTNQTRVLFQDGSIRSVTENLGVTQKYRQCNLNNTAEFTAGVESGGRRSGLARGDWQWFAFYIVKSQINPANFVVVADDIAPEQVNFATLNGRYGVGGWVYMGTLLSKKALTDPGGAIPYLSPFEQVGRKITLGAMPFLISPPYDSRLHPLISFISITTAAGTGVATVSQSPVGGMIGAATVPAHFKIADLIAAVRFSNNSFGSDQFADIAISDGASPNPAGGFEETVYRNGQTHIPAFNNNTKFGVKISSLPLFRGLRCTISSYSGVSLDFRLAITGYEDSLLAD